MSRKQSDLPAIEGAGVGKPEIPEIEEAAYKYVEVRDARLRLMPKEREAKDDLLALMRQHDQTIYEFDDHVVERTIGEDSVKVKFKQDPEE